MLKTYSLKIYAFANHDYRNPSFQVCHLPSMPRCFLASDGITLMYDLWSAALFYVPLGDTGRLFYLSVRSRVMLVLLSPWTPPCLPAEDLMKAPSHLPQKVNINQESNMSNREGSAESCSGWRKATGSVRFLRLTNVSASGPRLILFWIFAVFI